MKIYFKFAVIFLAGSIMLCGEETKNSPDGKFYAVAGQGASKQEILIFEKASKEPSIKMESIAYQEIRWSKDSKSLLIFDHLAGGGSLKVLTLKNNGWIRLDYDPPLEGIIASRIQYGVIKVSENEGFYNVEYLITALQASAPSKHYIIGFVATPPAQNISKPKIREISLQERDKIKTIGQRDVGLSDKR